MTDFILKLLDASVVPDRVNMPLPSVVGSPEVQRRTATLRCQHASRSPELGDERALTTRTSNRKVVSAVVLSSPRRAGAAGSCYQSTCCQLRSAKERTCGCRRSMSRVSDVGGPLPTMGLIVPQSVRSLPNVAVSSPCYCDQRISVGELCMLLTSCHEILVQNTRGQLTTPGSAASATIAFALVLEHADLGLILRDHVLDDQHGLSVIPALLQLLAEVTEANELAPFQPGRTWRVVLMRLWSWHGGPPATPTLLCDLGSISRRSLITASGYHGERCRGSAAHRSLGLSPRQTHAGRGCITLGRGMVPNPGPLTTARLLYVSFPRKLGCACLLTFGPSRFWSHPLSCVLVSSFGECCGDAKRPLASAASLRYPALWPLVDIKQTFDSLHRSRMLQSYSTS